MMEPDVKEKRLSTLHHIGRGMSDEDVVFAVAAVATAVSGTGAAVAIDVAGTDAAVAGAAGVIAVGVAVVSIAAGAIFEKTTEKHANAIAPEAAKKANMSGKGLLVGFMLAAGLTAGNWAHNAIQEFSGKPVESPAAAATHDYRISSGADCLLQKEFTPSAEGRQAGNDNLPYRVPGHCVVQEIKAPGR